MKKLTLVLCATSSIAFASENSFFKPLPPLGPMSKKQALKVALGRQLYFDTRLSVDDTVSCNSCHNVATSGTDNSKFSKGVGGQLGGRNSPTVFNASFQSVQFWDGRANTLADQAKGPIINPVEMGMPNHDVVVGKISKVSGYTQQFETIYGKRAPTVTIDRIADAIAAYEERLVTSDSPLDQYLRGNKKSLTEDQRKGMDTFQSVGCVACHSGMNLSGPALPKGTGFYQKFPTFVDSELESKYEFTKDNGRFDVTKKEQDKHFFRVPTLRNIARTAPYFHNGSVATLPEAIRIMGKTQLNKNLSEQEVHFIATFLESLSGKLPQEKKPKLPE